MYVKYVKVIILSRAKLPDQEYLYLVPENLSSQIKLGIKIIVPFGLGNKSNDAIVIDIIDNLDKLNKIDFDLKKIKSILSINSQDIFIDKNYLELAKWMSQEYFCLLSSCLKLMIPNKKTKTRLHMYIWRYYR